MRFAPTDIGKTKTKGESPLAASGRDSRSCPAARQRFCFMLRYDARDSSMTDVGRGERRGPGASGNADGDLSHDLEGHLPPVVRAGGAVCDGWPGGPGDDRGVQVPRRLRTRGCREPGELPFGRRTARGARLAIGQRGCLGRRARGGREPATVSIAIARLARSTASRSDVRSHCAWNFVR